jgi:hypothetical protein
MRKIATIDCSDIIELDDGSVRFFAGATIDGDGANGQFGQPPCYAPGSYNGQTLDVLANAGEPGNWYGVVTNTGEKTGKPIVQKGTDPCPGAYVSATSLYLPGKNGERLPDSCPLKYVDSATVPFVAVPPVIVKTIADPVLGCHCLVTNSKTGRTTDAVVADVGPSNHLGEISVACARALGVSTGTTHPANGGGASSPTIRYQLFPGKAAVVNGVIYPLQRK